MNPTAKTGSLESEASPSLFINEESQQGELSSKATTNLVTEITEEVNPPKQSPFRGTRRRETQETRSTNAASAQKTGCSYGDFAKMLAVAAALASLVVGAGGLLVYLGKLQISWAGVGAISQQAGLYIMLGGLGVSAILTALLTINCCMKNKQQTLGINSSAHERIITK